MILQNLIANLIATLDSIVLPLLTVFDAIRATSCACFGSICARTCQVDATLAACTSCGERSACWKNSGRWSPRCTSDAKELSSSATGDRISWPGSHPTGNSAWRFNIKKVSHVALRGTISGGRSSSGGKSSACPANACGDSTRPSTCDGGTPDRGSGRPRDGGRAAD
jgi:hypothetical protein